MLPRPPPLRKTLASVTVDLMNHTIHAKKHEPFVRQVEQIRDKVASHANCLVRSRFHIRVLNSEFSRPFWKSVYFIKEINLMFTYGETFEKLNNTRLSLVFVPLLSRFTTSLVFGSQYINTENYFIFLMQTIHVSQMVPYLWHNTYQTKYKRVYIQSTLTQYRKSLARHYKL